MTTRWVRCVFSSVFLCQSMYYACGVYYACDVYMHVLMHRSCVHACMLVYVFLHEGHVKSSAQTFNCLKEIFKENSLPGTLIRAGTSMYSLHTSDVYVLTRLSYTFA